MKNKIVKILLILTIAIIIVDQLSKIVVQNVLESQGTNSIGTENIGFEMTSNTGMALGFNSGNGKNIIITIFVLLIVAVFVKNQLERIDTKTAIALSLVIAGGVSNLIDRIFRKGVLDFIKFYSITFNIADICIVIGWVLLVVFLIQFSTKKTEG